MVVLLFWCPSRGGLWGYWWHGLYGLVPWPYCVGEPDWVWYWCFCVKEVVLVVDTVAVRIFWWKEYILRMSVLWKEGWRSWWWWWGVVALWVLDITVSATPPPHARLPPLPISSRLLKTGFFKTGEWLKICTTEKFEDFLILWSLQTPQFEFSTTFVKENILDVWDFVR